MNIINKLTLRHLMLNKKRTLVTIIGVILSVSMITGVTTFVSSAQDMMIRDSMATGGEWHARFENIDPAKSDVFLTSDEVHKTMFARNLGYAILEGSTNEDKPYLFVREFDEASLDSLALELVDGRLPERSDELVVSQHIHHNGGVKIEVGDKLELPIGQRWISGERMGQDNPFTHGDDFESEIFQPEFTREYTVTGIIERHRSEPHSAPGYTVISYLDRDSLGSSDWLDVSVTFKNVNKAIYQHGQDLAAQAGVTNSFADPHTGEVTYFVRYNDSLLALHGVTDNNAIGNVLNVFALIAITIIMVGSISLIYNAFAISISERSRQLGMMASVGATKGQKSRSVYFEGLLIGLVGIPLGLLAGTVGMGVTFLIVDPLLESLMNSPVGLHLVVSPISILVAVFFSAVTILVSVWIPSRRASKITPIDAIRQTQDVKLTGKMVKTSWLTRRLFGFEAELALKNLKRNRRRYRATVVSLSVSIILFLTVTAYANYMMVISNMYARDINYDMRVELWNVSSEVKRDFYSRVVTLEEIDEYVHEQRIYLGAMQVGPEMASDFVVDKFEASEGKYMYRIHIKSMDDDSFADYAQAVGVQTEIFDSGQFQAIAINQLRLYWDGVYVESEVIKAKVGDTLEIKLDRDGIVEEITLAALTDKLPMGSSVWNDLQTLVLIVSENTLASLVQNSSIANIEAGLFINSSEPEALEEKIQGIHQELFGGRLFVYNQARAAQEERQILLLLMIFIGGFIALITAISITNIFNTISTSIGLRRREFAMLKSVGMTPKGFNRMIRYESVFYGIKALSFALPASLGINYGLYRAMGQGFHFPFTMDWVSYCVAIVAVFTVVSITMLYSSAKFKRENIIDSLKDENM